MATGSQPAWQFEYSTEAGVCPEFAWQFWTNVDNWRQLEPGVEFELEGPLALGARGITRMRGQEPRRWVIVEFDRGRSWTSEMALPGASFFVRMQFEPDDAGTRITQQLWLQGEHAIEHLEAVRIFESTTAHGLKRIAEIITRAERGTARR